MTVQKVDPRDVTVDFIELTFKDQFLSRADIWRFKVSMLGKCVYVGKSVACLGIRSQVEGLLANNQDLYCGVIGADTKMIVRSRSSRLFWLVQMSAEMWEFAPDGELYYEKLLNRLLHVMINKWNESSVSHSVTIIAFSRSFYDKNQFPEDYNPLAFPFSEPARHGFGPGRTPLDANAANGYGPTVHIDPITGRYYEDFYKVLVMNYTGPDWSHLLGILKREFANYHETHRWRSPEESIPAEYKMYQCTKDSNASAATHSEDHEKEERDDGIDADKSARKKEECYVQWKTLPYGIPSRAMDGNILEAINVTLNILDKHYMDRDLDRTGQSIVMITAGCSIFNVDERLAQITKQRMMDNGVGMDMISLTTPPMHVVPLFICQTSTHGVPPQAGQDRYANEDHSVRRQRMYSVSSENLNSFEACPLRGLEREISDFEQEDWSDAHANAALNFDHHVHPDGDTDDNGEATNQEQRTYSIPHWVNITFLDFDCRCGRGSPARGGRGFPSHSQSSPSPTNGGSSRFQYSNRLLSHRAQICECQYDLNQRFLPLPPFRMFDLTAPAERLSFPISLKNMIQGYPRNFQNGDPLHGSHPPASVDMSPTDQSQRVRRLSDISDAISSDSVVVPLDQMQICRSPDYESAFSPRLKTFPSSFGASIITPEAFQKYDDEVFCPSATGLRPRNNDGRSGFSPPRHSEQNLTSTTFNGDVNPLESAFHSKNGKWALISNYGGGSKKRRFARGSSSLIGSLLSPRNEISIINQQNKTPTKAPPAFKRVSTTDSLLAAGNAALGLNISPTPIPKSSATRKSIVYPKQELHFQKTRLGSDIPQRTAEIALADSDRKEAHQERSLKTRARGNQDVNDRPYDQFPRDNNDLSPNSPEEKILGKSVDSSHRFFVPRGLQQTSQSKSSQFARSRACTSNVEASSTPPLASTPVLRHPSFPHLTRAMTMTKPQPAYYNELLLRSPPLSAGAAFPLSSSNENGSAHQRQLHSSSAHQGVRPRNSEVLSSSLVSASVSMGIAHQHSSSTETVRSSSSTNPFKYSRDTLDTASQRLTSDRRRWSHLFPVLTSNQQHLAGNSSETYQHGGVKPIHLGPNWKSLTSPAILPLTTDYYPSAKDLYTSYTESFYTLTLPSTMSETVPKYNNHDELLIEMVCQRLASDFQLVAMDSTTDLDPAHHHVPAIITNRGPSGESRSHTNTVIYYLSMGHRIHQMICDPELRTIDVKRYFRRDIQCQKNEPKKYRYSLWVDFTKSFHPLQQTFHEYPQPEENWNLLDHLLCGYQDDMSDFTKCRRIRFAILPPPEVSSPSQGSSSPSAYVAKFNKLIEYLQTRIAPSEDGVKEKISVKIVVNGVSPDGNDSRSPQQAGTLSYKICCKSSSCSSSRVKSEDTRAEWIMIHLEDTMHTSRNYHLDMRWLACSGISADEFVSTLKRKSKQAGLEVRRVPEYSRVSFLQIHPLLAPVFLPVPQRMLQTTANDDGSTVNSDQEKPLITILLERLQFVFDDERLADSNGIGYGLGIEKEERKPPGGGFKAKPRLQKRSTSSAARLMAEKWRTRGYKQYMHRHSPVFLRLIHNGLIWIPSYDYDEKSDIRRVEELFKEICDLIQASTTLQDLVDSCCCTEAA